MLTTKVFTRQNTRISRPASSSLKARFFSILGFEWKHTFVDSMVCAAVHQAFVSWRSDFTKIWVGVETGRCNPEWPHLAVCDWLSDQKLVLCATEMAIGVRWWKPDGSAESLHSQLGRLGIVAPRTRRVSVRKPRRDAVDLRHIEHVRWSNSLTVWGGRWRVGRWCKSVGVLLVDILHLEQVARLIWKV